MGGWEGREGSTVSQRVTNITIYYKERGREGGGVYRETMVESSLLTLWASPTFSVTLRGSTEKSTAHTNKEQCHTEKERE